MPIVMWNPDYSVKVTQFDNEHKKLFDLINQLHEAMKTGKGAQVIGDVLNALADYTKTHFGAEEQMMQSNGYPGYIEQKRAHDAFVARIVELQNNFNSGSTMGSIEVLAFLKDWLIKHIQVVDKQYSQFFNDKGIV